ncbi:MAG: PAS domain-containing protein [Burkholderiales bacterium]|nr:PAS domain-containing protein [Burkholderiales bacterium]
MARRGTLQVDRNGLLTWLETPACLLALPDTILAVNQPLADLVQRTPDALGGRPLRSLLPDEPGASAELQQQIALAEPGAPLLSRIRGADGQALPVVLRILACRDPAQRLLSLTPLASASAPAGAAARSMLEMEALMLNASVGILITRNRKMTRYNPMFGQMFGFAGDSGIGRPAAELFRSEQEYAALGALATPLLSQARPFKTELFMRRRDGSDLWVNLIGYVADAHDPRRATFWILEDRSAFKAAESALLQAQRDLAQAEKMAALGTLVVGVAHELNTPLGNALTAASTLHERSADILTALAGGDLRRSVLNNFLNDLGALSALVSQSCERAAQLVTGFKQVAVSRRNDQRARFLLAPLVAQVVAAQAAGLNALAGFSVVSIVCAIAPDLECDSYPDALAELLTNLLENALTHAYAGRQHGTLSISADIDDAGDGGDWIRLRVADDGIGMDALTLTRIFDPYFTTRLGHGRSGLGLPISRNLATTVLGGELHATSQPELGSCFTLRFPRIAPRLPARPQ